jgi:hypothetical protein
MPKLLRINNIGLKGLNTDVAPWELEPGFITHCRNIRITSGAIESSGGSKDWATCPTPFNPGYVMPIGAVTNDFWVVAGRSAVYAFDGTSWYDISSALGYAAISTDQELDWTGCVLGAIPVLNNPQTYPEYWSPQSGAQPLQQLPFDASNTWQAMGYQCKVIRSHKNFLFALNLTEGGIDYPDSYRWSHPADINGLPASWDETDTAFLAGKSALGGDGGAIIDGATLRDSFVIYSEGGIDILDYTGDAFVWRRRELSSTTGLLGHDCLIEISGQHFFLADGDIVVNDGNTLKSIIHNRIRKRLLSQMSVDYYYRARAIRNNAYSEIWFCVPEDNAEYPNVAYVYNWKDDSWAIRDLPDGLTSVGFGAQSEPSETWDTLAGNWDGNISVWGSRNITPMNDTVVGIHGADSKLIFLDPVEGIDNYTAVIERVNYPLETARNVTTITRVFPNIDGNQVVKIQFGSQDYPSGSVRWKQPVNFDPSTDRKIDVRTTGELHAWRISSTGNKFWRLSGMDIEYSNAGER